MRKRIGIRAAEGIGRRNSIGTRKAEAANSLEPSVIPIGTASAIARPRPIAHPRTVWRNALQKTPVCTMSHSARTVVDMAGRSCCEIVPVRDTISHSARLASTDATPTAILSMLDARSRRGSGSAASVIVRILEHCLDR